MHFLKKKKKNQDTINEYGVQFLIYQKHSLPNSAENRFSSAMIFFHNRQRQFDCTTEPQIRHKINTILVFVLVQAQDYGGMLWYN